MELRITNDLNAAKQALIDAKNTKTDPLDLERCHERATARKDAQGQLIKAIKEEVIQLEFNYLPFWLDQKTKNDLSCDIDEMIDKLRRVRHAINIK